MSRTPRPARLPASPPAMMPLGTEPVIVVERLANGLLLELTVGRPIRMGVLATRVVGLCWGFVIDEHAVVLVLFIIMFGASPLMLLLSSFLMLLLLVLLDASLVRVIVL